jgi:hypothetical protein
MEVPFLGLSSISSLDYEISSNNIEESAFTHLRNNVEVSFNSHTEVFVHLTLSWIFLPVICVDDIPLLVKSSMSLPDDNVLVFIIFVS